MVLSSLIALNARCLLDFIGIGRFIKQRKQMASSSLMDPNAFHKHIEALKLQEEQVSLPNYASFYCAVHGQTMNLAQRPSHPSRALKLLEIPQRVSPPQPFLRAIELFPTSQAHDGVR